MLVQKYKGAIFSVEKDMYRQTRISGRLLVAIKYWKKVHKFYCVIFTILYLYESLEN